MPAVPTGPIPKLPATITIPKMVGGPKQDGTLNVPSSPCFHYSAIQAAWLWYLVDLDLLTAYLEPLGMTPYVFDTRKKLGAMNLSFFNAAGFYGMGFPGNKGIGIFNETEVNLVGFATKVGGNVPQGISLADFLRLGEQTKRVGNYRLWVACDDPAAVAFGRQYYLENKFLVDYQYNVPTPNNPSATEWTWSCLEHTKQARAIYGATLDLQGQSPVFGNMSEWIDLSWDPATRRPVGSRRNYFGLHQTYLLPAGNNAVQVTFGQSRHEMRHDLLALIGTKRAAAVQVFASPTCIAEASPYYADL